eukprot:1187765-Prorocentrum_minimum.AAC.2
MPNSQYVNRAVAHFPNNNTGNNAASSLDVCPYRRLSRRLDFFTLNTWFGIQTEGDYLVFFALIVIVRKDVDAAHPIALIVQLRKIDCMRSRGRHRCA